MHFRRHPLRGSAPRRSSHPRLHLHPRHQPHRNDHRGHRPNQQRSIHFPHSQLRQIIHQPQRCPNGSDKQQNSNRAVPHQHRLLLRRQHRQHEQPHRQLSQRRNQRPPTAPSCQPLRALCVSACHS